MVMYLPALPKIAKDFHTNASFVQLTIMFFVLCLALGQLLITDRTFMGNDLAQGLVTPCLFSYISGSPFVIQDIYEASPQTFSLIFAVNSIGN